MIRSLSIPKGAATIAILLTSAFTARGEDSMVHPPTSGPTTLHTLHTMAKSPDSSVALKAITDLQASKDSSPETLQTLEALLDSPNDVIRSYAASALVRLGPPGKEIFKKRLANEKSITRRLDALTALRSDLDGLLDPALRDETTKLLVELNAAYNPPPQPLTGSIFSNGLFENPDFNEDWEVIRQNGAQGKVTHDILYRTSPGSLRLEKLNAEGELFLRSRRPLEINGRKQITARFYYHADTAPESAALQLFFEHEDGTLEAANSPNSWRVAESQTRVLNSPPGAWNKRISTITPPRRDGKLHIVIRLSGNPATVWIDDLSAPAKAIPSFYSISTEALDESAPALEPSKPVTAQVVKEGERARLEIDATKTPPILYFGMRGRYADYAGMEKIAGVRLMVSSIHLNDVENPRLGPTEIVWKRDTEFNFTTPLEWLDHVANNAPESRLILNFNVNWPAEWMEANPEERWRNAVGEGGYGTWLQFSGFASTLPKPQGYTWWPSPSSEKAIDAAAEGIRQFVQAIRNKPYFNRIAGCFISGGHDGQFYTAKFPDYSEPAIKAFREWLTHRYGSDETLQKSWKRSSVTLATAKIPNYDQLRTRTEARGTLFLNPAKEADYADHLAFQAGQGLRIREKLAATFKEALGRDTIGMTWQMGGGRGQGTEDIYLQSKALDMMVTQPGYSARYPGNISGTLAIQRSSALHGNLSIKELDLRTWLRQGGDEIGSLRLSASMTPGMWRSTYRKEAAQMIATGQGYWLYDITPTHFRDPVMLEEIRNGIRAYNELELKNTTPFQPGVAVAWVDEGPYWLAHSSYAVPLIERLESFTYAHLKSSGVPFDYLFLSDLLQNQERLKYKVVVLMNAYRLTDSQKAAINEKLQRNNTTLIFNYATGYLSDDGFSETALSELSGISTKAERTDQLDTVHFLKSSIPLIKQIEGIAGMHAMAQLYATAGKDTYLLNPRGFQRFVITDPAATPLASYSDGATAIAIKHLQGWTSVSLGAPGLLDARLLNRLAREAGAPVLTEPEVAMEFNGRFLSLHGLKNGPVDVTLPQEAIVTDFDTGETLGSGKELTIPLQAGQTRWFKVTNQ